MVKHQTRLFVAMFVVVDVLCSAVAWMLAYYLRFHSAAFLDLLPAIKGIPPQTRYALLLPLIAVLWPAVLYFHGLYQVKRGRSRIDEFFAILFSVLIASALMLGATLYVRVYYRYQPEVAPQWEYSQAVFGLFIVADVVLLNLGRWALRSYLHRMWAAGHNVRRVVVAGAGDLGQMVAETLQAHRELGYRVVGFLDDRLTGDIEAAHPVPCKVTVGVTDATELSLAENVVRDNMHPADQFEAFRNLIDKCATVTDVAARFGITETHVEFDHLRAVGRQHQSDV